MALGSPNVLNYTVGKGVVYFRKSGQADFRHLGNCPSFEFTPEIEKLDHFSSQSGVRSKDRTIVLEKKGTLRIVMEEITPENLALALLGAVTSGDSGGDENISIFSASEIAGEVKFVGTNDVGAKFTWDFLSVSFIPGSAINPISDEWMQLEITGEVAAVSGVFGTVTKTADGA